MEVSLFRIAEAKSIYDDVLKDNLKLGYLQVDQVVTITGYLPHHPMIKPERVKQQK